MKKIFKPWSWYREDIWNAVWAVFAIMFAFLLGGIAIAILLPLWLFWVMIRLIISPRKTLAHIRDLVNQIPKGIREERYKKCEADASAFMFYAVQMGNGTSEQCRLATAQLLKRAGFKVTLGLGNTRYNPFRPVSQITFFGRDAKKADDWLKEVLGKDFPRGDMTKEVAYITKKTMERHSK